MTDREKLIELMIKTWDKLMNEPTAYRKVEFAGLFADHLIAHGVTVQEQNGCEHCRTASHTENPFTVITQMGREVKTQFNFCPNCGRRLIQPPKEDK